MCVYACRRKLEHGSNFCRFGSHVDSAAASREIGLRVSDSTCSRSFTTSMGTHITQLTVSANTPLRKCCRLPSPLRASKRASVVFAHSYPMKYSALAGVPPAMVMPKPA